MATPSSIQDSQAFTTGAENVRLAWLALVMTPGMGPTRIARTMEALGGADLFERSLTELESLRMPAAAAQFIADGRAREAAEKELQMARDAGAQILTRHDAAFPARLLEIYDPPSALWVRGDAELLSWPGIAVVGTRSPTPYGAGMAELLSRDLSNRGLGIFSGMARGVDTAAHKGALDAGGRTLAVWGTGIDVVYPKENKKLAEQIVLKGGAIVTEFPMGTFPAPQNFPIRNRVLSGLSVGVLVVEAAEYSGTRITARCAMEQNRDVYAVPGNVTNKNSWGPNTLIKQGAKLTATWEDVWEDLPSEIRLQLEERRGAGADGVNESKPSGTASLFTDQPMGPQERLIFQRLRHDQPVQLDELMEQMESEMNSAEVFTALFELELSGRVKSLPGKNYVRSF